MNNSSSYLPERDFEALLQEALENRDLMDELLRHSVFLNRGYRICRWHVRGTNENAQELFSRTFIKVHTAKDKLRADNTPDQRAFFAWVYQIALNIFRDQRRKDKRELNRLQSLSLPDEEFSDETREFDLADPRVDLEGDVLIEQFLEFTNTLPAKHRRAIILRLKNYPDKGCSFEDIARQLTGEGIACTHVTVRSWVRKSLKAFFDSSRVSSGKKAVSF